MASWIEDKVKTRMARADAERVNAKLSEEFNSIDIKSISTMNDVDLATWQSRYPKESPQFIFADQQWKYRLAKKTAKFTAIIATISALTGAVVGFSLKSWTEIPEHKPSTETHQNDSPPITKE